MRYEIEESFDQVPGIAPELRTRFRWRAERRARKLNELRIIKSYTWKVVNILGTGRYEVRAFQNYLRPL